MSQEKAQLIAPIDSSFTVPGVTVSGVITATSFDGTITGVADSITQGKNLNVGVVTALSFAGNLTGNAGGLTGSPNTVAGVVTATSFVGGLTGNITGDVIGNATGVGASIKPGQNLNVGIATAWKWYGDGSLLTGVGVTAYVAQEVTASSAETIIDLTYGNLVYLTQSSNTTVGFASTAATQNISIVRNTDSSNTITWPDRITWDGGTAPTLIDNPESAAFQVFRLTTVDSGLTYNGWEEMKNDPALYQAWVWGWSAYGVLGASFTNSISSPVQLPGNNWKALNTQGGWTSFSNAGTKTDGTLWSWGYNVYGDLGQNNRTYYSSPKQIPGTTWNGYPKMKTRMGSFTKSDGTLWTTGKNTVGALGLNDTADRSSPTQIPGTTWASGQRQRIVGNSAYNMLAIKTDGTLWSWGENYLGSLGLNQSSPTKLSSPTQVGTDTTWSKIDSGSNGLIALKTDGSMWSWGYNSPGGMGQNNQTQYSSPRQVGTDTDWSDITTSGLTSLALKTDGTLWSWGYNVYGGLGLNDAVQRSSPTQVGTDTTWSQIQAQIDYRTNQALKTDGTLWMWGNNQYGQLGQNSVAVYSSPVQIPGSSWSSLAVSGAIKAIE